MPLLPREGHKIDDLEKHAGRATAAVRAPVELRVVTPTEVAPDAARSGVAGMH